MKREVMKNVADIIVFTIVLASIMRLMYQISMPEDFFMGLICAMGSWIIGLGVSYWSTKHFMKLMIVSFHHFVDEKELKKYLKQTH